MHWWHAWAASARSCSARCCRRGVLVLTLVTPWQASLIGYVLVGLGCANIAPALFSLAGHQTRMPGALAITAVSTLGFAGILAGRR
jgi:hypothetical protein